MVQGQVRDDGTVAADHLQGAAGGVHLHDFSDPEFHKELFPISENVTEEFAKRSSVDKLVLRDRLHVFCARVDRRSKPGKVGRRVPVSARPLWMAGVTSIDELWPCEN